MIRRVGALLLMLFAVAGFLGRNAYAASNVIQNEGFELQIGASPGNWDNTANRGLTRVQTGAPAGNAMLRIDEALLAVGTSGAFTFQTSSTPVAPGDFVSFSALVRANTLDPGDAGQIRIEFKNSSGTDIGGDVTTSVSAVTAGFNRVSVSGRAPVAAAQVVFVLRIQPSAVGGTSQVDFDDTLGTISHKPLFLEATPSSTSAKKGQMRLIALHIANSAAETQTNVKIFAFPPPGIQAQLHDARTTEGDPVIAENGSVIFNIGTLSQSQEKVIAFPIILTSGLVAGRTYEISAFATSSSGASETIHIQIRPELDPVFEEGTIIGKVFNDLNKNTVQDKGEPGIPWVRLATEEGIEIITDEHGRYHIPAVKPGRHIVKIDGHSLPEGTQFISEESFLVKTSPGILSKANFAVLVPASAMSEQFEKELSVSVTQGLDTSMPDLDVRMEPEYLRLGIGVLETQPVFKITINYPDFVKSWFLEIRDETGKEIWTGFGVSAPPAEVTWSGETDSGLLIKPGIYSYRFKVEDKENRQDWTPLHFFRAVSKADPESEKQTVEIPAIGDFNIFKDGKRSIPMVAKPTLRINGRTKPGNEVTINGQKVYPNSDGSFQTEVYTTPGDKEIVVTASNLDGEKTTVKKQVQVKDSTFFMVALGEEQLGVNFDNGTIETAGSDDLYKNGFYEDGRLSYYLRGKLKGKFLVKSHYDSSDKRSALFRNLDPDEYYPVYGDGSTRNYDAINTLSRFYLVIEMDRSYVKYGSFETNFTDTELSRYNRTLSGVSGSYETLATTPYGDPKRGVKFFGARGNTRADHNEFAATGGSLYYLRNKNVIQGSEKLRVEVRDKIQSISVDSRDLEEGKDYEIDYSDGRILLTRPLSSLAASDTLINDDVIGGNPVYLIADYEYDAGSNALGTSDGGLRGYTHIGDHIRVGATAVKEQRNNHDYDLRGIDGTMKLGKNTKVTGEYAETAPQQTGQAVSYNGGLSFGSADPFKAENSRFRENAYLVKAESKPVKPLETSLYLQGVDPGFSTDRSANDEGTRKYGVAAKWKFTDSFFARYRYDETKLQDELFDLASNGVSASLERQTVHTAQLAYDDHKWLAEGEYKHTDFDTPVFANRIESILSELAFKQGLSGRVGYHINDRLLPYVKVQTSLQGRPNHQYGGGVRYEVVNNVFAYLEEMGGNFGDSTYFGFEKYQGTTRSYANIRMLDRGIGSPLLTTTIGNSFAVSEKSRIYSERQHSEYQTEEGYSNIYGYENKITDHWGVEGRFERRHLDDNRSQLIDPWVAANVTGNNTTNVISGAVSYNDEKKTRARTSLELRRDQDDPEMRQWVTRNVAEYKFNPDLTYLGKLDYGMSRFLRPDNNAADFTEFSTGIAYRPVNNDRFNVLSRYSYIRNMANDAQFASEVFLGTQDDETAHVIALDVAYDIHRYLGMVEKLAYKRALLEALGSQTILDQMLIAHRFNAHITKKWDVALEYRFLWQWNAAENLRHGLLAEIDRELYDYVRFGLGYNFTDFDDDLRKPNSYSSHGPFIRFTGKF